MEQELLRKVQLTLLEIAVEIKRVCEENDIRYFLSDGTFLGAVRHQGFIPWDDDMDMGMLRADYEKFCRVAPTALKPEYCLETWDLDAGYGLPFAKVMKRNTVYLESKKNAKMREKDFQAFENLITIVVGSIGIKNSKKTTTCIGRHRNHLQKEKVDQDTQSLCLPAANAKEGQKQSHIPEVRKNDKEPKQKNQEE